MRELLLRQTAFQALAQAQAGAIRAIGLRGDRAIQAMREGIRQKRFEQEQERMRTIARWSHRTHFEPVTDAEMT